MPAQKAPLRTALIGLSSTAITSWASTAHLPGLLTSTGRSKLPITALLNSSVAAAQSAIETYKLNPDTKAYGSPEDLANDPDVDLVICNTRVDKHFETILPSIKKGKDVFVEWPIASNPEDIKTLIAAAQESGSRVAVGLQRRWAPPVLKVKEVLSEGKLGKVLSAEVRTYGGTLDREILPEGLKYFAERKVGGNPVTISFGHLFDWVLSVLGDLDPETVHTKMQLQRPSVRIRNPTTKQITATVTSNVPDLISLHAGIKESPTAVDSATLSFIFRRGQPFPGTPSFTFSIACEHGEIRLVAPAGSSLETASEKDPVTVHVHWHDDDRVELLKWDWNETQKELPLMAKNVWRSLESFADGKEPEEGWVSLEDAAGRAALVEGFMKGWEAEGAK